MWQIIGHERAAGLLDRSLKSGKLSHAYLFVGPRHVGKMTLAINLAQALNCLGEERPCGECSQCRRIGEGKHPDVQVITVQSETKTEIGIDQIKELQHSSILPPYEGRHKVFIIEEAQRLSDEASNCLLKTLEEPPPGVLIILLAENERALLPTILSRCQIVELRPLPAPLIEEELRRKAGPQEAETLARLSSGCPGWAFSALRDSRILKERQEEITGILEMLNAGIVERFSYAAELSSRFSRSREKAFEVLNLWLSLWRDMLLIKGEACEFITNIDQVEILERKVDGYTIDQIKGFIQSLKEAWGQLQDNANSRLVFEVLMLGIPEKGKAWAM